MLTLLVSTALVMQWPPPPPPTYDPFFLFFDYASPELPPRQAHLVGNIHKALKSCGFKPPVEIVGHADRKGSSSSNLWLSRRRAEAVKAALMSRGVPSNAITVRGIGEDRPLINTADGVPEPQNRYVTVILHGTC